MNAWYRNYLARAAARERDARAENYPGMVERGEVARDFASADLAAWRTITLLFATTRVETTLGWPDLIHAASQAMLRREEAVRAAPGDGDLLQRRDGVEAILRALRLNQRLLTIRPAPRRQAA